MLIAANPYESPTHCEPRKRDYSQLTFTAAVCVFAVVNIASYVVIGGMIWASYSNLRQQVARTEEMRADLRQLQSLRVGGPETVLRESVDQVEVNNYFDDCGKYVFTQLIFRDWNEHAERFQIRAWRMVKPIPVQPPEQPFVLEVSEWAKCDLQLKMIPRLSPMLPVERDGQFVCHWFDGDVERIVSAPECVETYTVFDAEITERESLPKEMRRELRSPKTAGAERNKGR